MINGDVRCKRCDRWFHVNDCSKRDLEAAKKRADKEYPPMSYSAPGVPKKYKCKDCGVTGCKLWRDYQREEPLRCCDCAVKDQHKEWLELNGFVIREDGRHNGHWLEKGVTKFADGTVPTGTEEYCFNDAIGWMVPAVPSEDGVGYWGYTSVSDAGVDWWKKLPLRIKT